MVTQSWDLVTGDAGNGDRRSWAGDTGALELVTGGAQGWECRKLGMLRSGTLAVGIAAGWGHGKLGSLEPGETGNEGLVGRYSGKGDQGRWVLEKRGAGNCDHRKVGCATKEAEDEGRWKHGLLNRGTGNLDLK